MQPFTIGNHLFLALSVVDATFAAVEKARELFRAGLTREAEALRREALDLRRIATAGLPAARAALRASSRFRRPGR